MQDVVPDRYPIQQLHLGLFTSHEISAWEQEQRRKNSRREIHGETKARRRFWFQEDKASRSLFDAMDAAVLDPPLGGPQEGNELNCAVDPLGESTDDREQLISPAGEEKLPWSDEAVAQLHEAVLHHSLKALQAKGNGVEKREVLEWIFAPQPMVVALEGVDGQRSEAVLPQHLPLSPATQTWATRSAASWFSSLRCQLAPTCAGPWPYGRNASPVRTSPTMPRESNGCCIARR